MKFSPATDFVIPFFSDVYKSRHIGKTMDFKMKWNSVEQRGLFIINFEENNRNMHKRFRHSNLHKEPHTYIIFTKHKGL